MGHGSYSQDNRTVRATNLGYYHKSVDDVFEQNKKREIHESMEPKKALLRESRDSDEHPNSVPIIVTLDVTGSMGRIPHHLVKDGLPNMVGNIIEHGIADPQILFLAVGDARCDNYPLQVGQFESGDEELDLWLTRTYLEGHGGGNGGESYSLAWYFGARHTVTDAWEKRNQKGFLFTIGDEECHKTISNHEVNEVMGVNPERSFSDTELLKDAQEKYHVFHLHIMEGSMAHYTLPYWKNLLGENCIEVNDYTKIDEVISNIITSFDFDSPALITDSKKDEEDNSSPSILL